MKLRLLCVGKLRSAPVRAICEDYLARLRPYGPAEVLEVKAGGDAAQEAARLLAALDPSDAVVVLDERGTPLSSRELAGRFTQWESRSTRRVVFILGGAYGLTDEVRKRGQLLSLSRLTFPHELCRALVLEQLYRARTIQRGEPYHHD